MSVLGVDPARPTLAWRARIGLVVQSSTLPPELTVTELVARYARPTARAPDPGYYPHARDVAEAIELVGLTDKRKARAGRLSGGQQRRLDVALALVGDPDLVFLDEPTTGFDPAARRAAWSMIESLRDLGKTVLLTTHYMDEAEQLADYVAILVSGRIAAQGTPATIGGRDDAAVEISFLAPAGFDARIPGAGETRCENGTVVLKAADATQAVGELIDWARQHDTNLAGLQVTRPTLEDIYLGLAATP